MESYNGSSYEAWHRIEVISPYASFFCQVLVYLDSKAAKTPTIRFCVFKKLL